MGLGQVLKYYGPKVSVPWRRAIRRWHAEVMQKACVARREIAVLALLATASAGGGAQSLTGDVLRKLRFSPDSRYILAQDASEIMVLTVKPLAVLFRIPVTDATYAQFTPDSLQVIFLSGGPRADAAHIKLAKSDARLEYWSIANGTHMDPHQLPGHACETGQLSPDGRILACYDLFGALWLIDTVSGSTIFRKDRFGWNGTDLRSQSAQTIVPPDPGFVDALSSPDVRIAFSPDARYVIIALQEHVTAAPKGLDRQEREWWRGRAVVWDLRLQKPVALKNHLSVLTDSAIAPALDESPDRRRFFTFVAPDRLLVSDLIYAKNGHAPAMLIEFPSGRLLSSPVIPAGALFPATDPDFVIVRPAGQTTIDHPQRTAAAELHTGELIVSQTPALDVLGRYYVAESRPGWVGLYERGKGLQATVELQKVG